MPGLLRVLVKGMDKVIEFPTDTPMELIESSIKGGWNDIESIAGLPMDTASRMERAKFLGFDPDQSFFHGTKEAGFDAFDPEFVGKNFNMDDQGFFFSSDIRSAREAGSETKEVLLPKNAKTINVGDEDPTSFFDSLEDNFPGGKAGFFEEMREGGDDLIFDQLEEGADTVLFKNNKGEITAVSTDPSKIRDVAAAFDPSKKGSSRLLASVAGGAVGLGALAQSDESEASQSANRLLQEGLIDQKSKAWNIPSPALNKLGLWLQRGPQSLMAEGVGRGIETLSLGRENELTDEEIRKRAIDVGLNFL